MRRPLIALASCAVLLVGGAASANPVVPVSPMVPDVPGTTVTSANVRHLGTIPLEGVGVSMRVVKVGAQVRAFVSGAASCEVVDLRSEPWKKHAMTKIGRAHV